VTDTRDEDEISLETYRMQLVTEQAADWLCRVGVPDAPLEDRKGFLQWLKRSPENIAAVLWITGFDGNARLMRLLNAVDDLDESNVIEVDFKTRLAEGQPAQPVGQELPRVRNEQPRMRSAGGRNSSKTAEETTSTRKLGPIWRRAATLAALTLTLLFAFFAFDRHPEGVVETRAAQIRKMTLDDGSILYLDARTRIKIEFSEARRTVHLYHGSLACQVTKDSRRPFTVSTDDVDVTAVGARFGVEIDGGVTTTVEEGVVKVDPRAGGAGAAILLHAGQQLHVPPAAAMRLSIADVAEVDAKRELSWVTGQLEMRKTTLGEIARQFNRRQAIQADFRARDLASRRVDLALMRLDDIEDFIELVESLGVTVIREGSTLILAGSNAR
jgi:transmembrane sensor